MDGGNVGESSSGNTEVILSKLKIAGCWAGSLDVILDCWTVSMLKEEIARRANFPPESIKMISSGKVLGNGEGGGEKRLCEVGLKNNSKVLVTKIQLEAAKAFKEASMAEEDRARRLARIRDAVSSLAERNLNESLTEDNFSLEVENLDGKRVKIGTDSDQRAIMMGLMLHSNAKRLIKQAKYKEALDVLMMGEEAFSLCDPKIVYMMDNVAILQIDTVWCYFMLRDISWLSMAGIRLSKARSTIERSYGKTSNRARVSLKEQHLQRIIFLRLELLEGVVAYHSGHLGEARKALTSAQEKYLQFQVSDEGLTKLMSMGYNARSAKRALIISGLDVENAANFLIEEKIRKTRRIEADKQREQEIREQKGYGLTSSGKVVNMESLAVLTSLGIDKRIAAESLRRTENDVQRALDELTDPETHCSIQLAIVSHERMIEELVLMGFQRSRVLVALNQTGSKDDALSVLIAERSSIPTAARSASASSSSAVNEANNSISGADGEMPAVVEDREVEDEITQGVSADPLSELDIEVAREGEAIGEYMALLGSIGRDE